MINLQRAKLSKSSSLGFTLIELLVAMLILAILSVLAYGGLNAVMRAQDHSVGVADKLKSLQLAMRYMEQDFRQISSRPSRDQFGDLQPSLYTTNNPLLTLTKSGWHNPGGLTHSEMQRVSYDVVDRTLVRRVWQAMDGGDEEDVLETKLLENVEKLEFRFQNERSDWEEDWPPAGQAAPTFGQTATSDEESVVDPNNPAGVGAGGQTATPDGEPAVDPNNPADPDNPADPAGADGQAAAPATSNDSPIPRMLEFTLTVEPWGEIKRLINYQ